MNDPDNVPCQPTPTPPAAPGGERQRETRDQTCQFGPKQLADALQRVLRGTPADEPPAEISRLLWYHALVKQKIISEKEFKRVKRRLLYLPEASKDDADSSAAASTGGSGSS